MLFEFSKFQSLGNDFILINNFQDFFFDSENIARLCDRRFGIGADGVILYKSHSPEVFQMKFYNPDGSNAKLCGNGLRCLFLETKANKIMTDAGTFLGSISGEEVVIEFPYPEKKGIHELSIDHEKIQFEWINSGVDHIIIKVSDLSLQELKTFARKLRFHPFFQQGVNVNFLMIGPKTFLKTYERGVEDFTLACGTGALACFHSLNVPEGKIFFSKERFCEFQKIDNKIKMKAHAKKVFVGKVEIPILL